MPELPEVEVLVRHLAPRLEGKTLRNLRVLDARSIRDSTPSHFGKTLTGARIQSLRRRGKHLVFALRRNREDLRLIAHLGMTGRLYVAPAKVSPGRHTTVLFTLGRDQLVFDDVRRFGGLTLDASVLERLGPEPLERAFTVDALTQVLRNSRQPVKVRLLDQATVAGIGNIYASEALFLARIHPRTPSRRLNRPRLQRLHIAIRQVLTQAIRFGSSVPLNFGTTPVRNSLFYYGKSEEDPGGYDERLRVYDREDEPCRSCATRIRRIVQAGRSSFLCPRCQT
jgi:formamidopyrimidine-DNA glycosylase